MKRRITSIVLMIILIVTFMAGCGIKKDGNKNETEVTTYDTNQSNDDNTSKDNKDDNKDDNKNVEILSAGFNSKHVFADNDIFTDDNVFIHYKYSAPYLLEKDEKKYPELVKTLEEYRVQYDKDMKKIGDDLVQTAIDDGEDRMYTELSDVRYSKIVRADSNVFSFYNKYECYYGGVHGDYGYDGLNFDTKTGEKLKITDVVKDMDGFLKRIDEELKENYYDLYETFYSVDENLEKFGKAEDIGIEWTISSEGVTVYFNTYVISAYAAGNHVVTVSFKSEPELFNEKYTKVSDEYIIPCINFIPNYIDVDGDNEIERIAIESYCDDDGIYQWIIKSDDNEIEINDTTTAPEGYIVYSNKKYYMYLFDESDASGRLKIINLANLEYNQEKDEYITFITAGYEEKNNENRTVVNEKQIAITNPSDFALQKMFYVLSTIPGYKNYKVGSGGYPEPKNELYNASTNVVLKGKMNIECDVVDINGKKVKKGNISEGKYYMFVHTSDENWVDLQEISGDYVVNEGSEDFAIYYKNKEVEVDENKEIYRIYLEWNDEMGVRTVGDINEYDIFDGILYAG